jgi:3-oxoacyl-[acyl-carrier-protein] synthase II
MRRNVVISGLGMLSGAGANLDEARAKFIAGTCCLSPITDPRAARLRAKFAGQVSSCDASSQKVLATPRRHSTDCQEQRAGAALSPFGDEASPLLNFHDRHIHMALVAAREALTAAKVRPAELGRRMGLIFSTCSGPMLLIEAHYERIIRGNPALTEAELFAKRYYSGAQVLARALGVGGLCTTVVTACSASTAAIALAADLIRCGMLDAALAGGADSFSVSTLAGFDGLKATSDGKCAPFSKPYGLNLGEAAAFAFLETADSAQQRGARVRAEVLGSGMSNDAYHCSAPEPAGRGLAEAMKRALQDAGLSPEQITYINAHGTGTEANDKAECKALHKVFGNRAGKVPISSTKSMVGHCLGAAGAVEAMASIVCAEAGVLPPTANFAGPREGCAVDCVPQAGRPWDGPRVFLSNNSAFGGHNASLALAVPGSQSTPHSALRTPHSALPIYITACGVVSAAGIGIEALVNAQRSGRPALRIVSLPGLPALSAGMVDEAAVDAFDRRLNLRQMDRSSKWATVAARLAIREAKFPEKPAALAELGLFLNLSAGPSWAESEFLTSFLSNNHQVTQLAAFPYIVPSSVAGNVCRALMLSGHNLTLSPGPGGGLSGLAPAIAALRSGHTGAILCGAVDELSERILADGLAAGLRSGENAAPGEGAAVLLLETGRHATARGAKPLAEIRGIACATGERSLEQAVADALMPAGLERGAVGAVCFDGPASVLERLHPAWPARAIRTAPATGRLEGAQPLLDLAIALREPRLKPGTPLLVITATPPGGAACAVISTVDIAGHIY